MNEKIFLYDGSIEGLFTIIYDLIFIRKIIPKDIIREENYLNNLLDDFEFINVSDFKYNKLTYFIKESIGEYSLYQIYNAFLSNNKEKEKTIFDYLRYGFKYGSKINFLRNLDCVLKIQKISKQVARENHRYKGFVRFKKNNKNIYYSIIEPDNNILGLISQHFSERLKNEFWIIKDIKRNIASIYNKERYIIVDASLLDFSRIIESDDEQDYEMMWKNFVKTIAIKERKNLKCQMNFMPKRYWKYMLETEV